MQTRKNGNSFQRSLDMGALSATQTRSGSLMKTDKTDFYRFTLGGKSSASFTLNNLQANANLELYNGNKALVAASRRGGKKNEQITTDLDAGTYYLKVSGKNGKTRYNLSSSATPSLVTSPPVTPAPVTPPKQGRFRVSLSGFTVNNATSEDWQDYDGKGDEVFIMSQTYLSDAGGSMATLPLNKSKYMGDAISPDRILAGTAEPNLWERLRPWGVSKVGGLRTGDSFPSAAPWQRNSDFTTDSVPMVLWEGSLASGQNTALVAPTIWEHDSYNPFGGIPNPIPAIIDKIPLGNEIKEALNLVESFLSGGAVPPSLVADQSALFKSGRELLGENVLGANVVMRSDEPNKNQRDRPIGMKSAGGNLVGFDPKVLPLSYELADKLSKTNLSGKGAGVISLRYADDSAFAGDYTLHLKVEQVPG
jgi:hypothetical protein